MKCFFWGLLIVAGAAPAAASPITVVPPQKGLSPKQAARLGVDLYNRKGGENITFRLLKANPQPEWDAAAPGIQKLDFTIQETECLAEEKRLEEECNFRDEGLVKECSGLYFMDETPGVVDVTCDTATDKSQPKRVKRFQVNSFREFWKWLLKILRFEVRFTYRF